MSSARNYLIAWFDILIMPSSKWIKQSVLNQHTFRSQNQKFESQKIVTQNDTALSMHLFPKALACL